MWEAIKNATYSNRRDIYRDGFTIVVGGIGLGIFALLIGLELHLPSMIFGLFVPTVSSTVDYIFERHIMPKDE